MHTIYVGRGRRSAIDTRQKLFLELARSIASQLPDRKIPRSIPGDGRMTLQQVFNNSEAARVVRKSLKAGGPVEMHVHSTFRTRMQGGSISNCREQPLTTQYHCVILGGEAGAI